MSPKEWKPWDLLELSGYFWRTCALHAGVKLGIFSELGPEGQTAEQVAGRVNGSADGVERLMNALTAMDLLTKSEGRFSCPPSLRRLLAKDSSSYIGHIIMHHHHLMESWAHLDQSVLSGLPNRERSSARSEEWRESFLMGMFNMAMALAPRLAEALDLSSRRRLLDLGGGPGTYAIQFCLRNPELKATVFDLPATRPFAEKTIARFNLNDRIAFSAGDYHEEQIPGRYDLAWLSHILHAEGPEACMQILNQAISVLEPGGMVVIHEFILKDSMDGPLFPALFSLNMLLGTPSGRSYSEQQLKDMLKTAGARDVHRIPVETPNDSGLIVGRV
jgi:ubiquinone/menaquinone biosynthesis C-methylase UbiE